MTLIFFGKEHSSYEVPHYALPPAPCYFFSFDLIILSISFSKGATAVQSVQQRATGWMDEKLEFDSRQRLFYIPQRPDLI
jgi:hypothetical protein